MYRDALPKEWALRSVLFCTGISRHSLCFSLDFRLGKNIRILAVALWFLKVQELAQSFSITWWVVLQVDSKSNASQIQSASAYAQTICKRDAGWLEAPAMWPISSRREMRYIYNAQSLSRWSSHHAHHRSENSHILAVSQPQPSASPLLAAFFCLDKESQSKGWSLFSRDFKHFPQYKITTNLKGNRLTVLQASLVWVPNQASL